MKPVNLEQNGPSLGFGSGKGFSKKKIDKQGASPSHARWQRNRVPCSRQNLGIETPYILCCSGPPRSDWGAHLTSKLHIPIPGWVPAHHIMSQLIGIQAHNRFCPLVSVGLARRRNQLLPLDLLVSWFLANFSWQNLRFLSRDGISIQKTAFHIYRRGGESTQAILVRVVFRTRQCVLGGISLPMPFELRFGPSPGYPCSQHIMKPALHVGLQSLCRDLWKKRQTFVDFSKNFFWRGRACQNLGNGAISFSSFEKFF